MGKDGRSQSRGDKGQKQLGTRGGGKNTGGKGGREQSKGEARSTAEGREGRNEKDDAYTLMMASARNARGGRREIDQGREDKECGSLASEHENGGEWVNSGTWLRGDE